MTDAERAWATFVTKEREFIASRRDGKTPQPEDITGLALSGGGIRSATFCVGFLQALSARGLIPHIDYLSTVSGGSYAGSFFGSLFVTPEWRGDGTHGEPAPEFARDKPLQSPLGVEAVRRLRDMGRYLTPSGTSDAFYGGAIVARNWVAVQFVIGMAALLLFWTMHRLDAWVDSWDMPLPLLPMTPTLTLATVLLTGATMAGGAAYWLTRRDTIPVKRRWRLLTNLVFLAFVGLLGYALSPWLPGRLFGGWTPPDTGETAFAAYVIGLALVLIVVMERRFGEVTLHVATLGGESTSQSRIAAEDRVRAALSRWMATGLTWTLIFAGLGAIDALGHQVLDAYRAFRLSIGGPSAWWQKLENAWPFLVTIFPPVASYVASRGLKGRQPPTDPGNVDTRTSWAPTLIVVFGALTLAVWLVLWSALATLATERLAAAESWRAIEGTWWKVWLLLIGLNLVQSLCFSFINLSSLSTFYAARLRRAYIGASSYGNPRTSVRADDPQDTISIPNYYTVGIANGAPLHLINVTIAETVADGSNLVARDRKGKPMHLSPAGLVWEGDKPGDVTVLPREGTPEGEGGEELPLANWVAISGAAVSAAIGAGTSLGTSILATMANVRLGYWWRRQSAQGWRAALWSDGQDWVQRYLFLELRGKFTGTARGRWYLTDGGHFENTGVYPLLKRKVAFIIACDNGADPHYRMDDVMRLMGRARTDLGAKISFLDDAALAELLGTRSPIAGALGSLSALSKHGSPVEPGGPIAALATIDYGGDDAGLLLLVKPRIAYDEPPEVLAYHARSGGFPQQTTGDQFFDEEQWEAYRRLGEIAGERLFPAARPAGMTGWLPNDALGHDPEPAPHEGFRDRIGRLLGR